MVLRLDSLKHGLNLVYCEHWFGCFIFDALLFLSILVRLELLLKDDLVDVNRLVEFIDETFLYD